MPYPFNRDAISQALMKQRGGFNGGGRFGGGLGRQGGMPSWMTNPGSLGSQMNPTTNQGQPFGQSGMNPTINQTPLQPAIGAPMNPQVGAPTNPTINQTAPLQQTNPTINQTFPPQSDPTVNQKAPDPLSPQQGSSGYDTTPTPPAFTQPGLEPTLPPPPAFTQPQQNPTINQTAPDFTQPGLNPTINQTAPPPAFTQPGLLQQMNPTINQTAPLSQISPSASVTPTGSLAGGGQPLAGKGAGATPPLGG